MLKMAQKLTLIIFVVIGLLAISTFYVVESSQRDRGRRVKNPPFCQQLCDNPKQCGESCPNCPYDAWRTMVCVK
uniref:Putative 5.3 kDa protein n=1 Tax=Ixodes ricinus TaxID=34613 RepID=A0A0K8R8L0_IXORI